MSYLTKFVIKSVMALSVVNAFAGDPVNWTSPVDGSWETGISWNTGFMPSASSHAILGHVNPYQVSINSFANVYSLSIFNSSAELLIQSSSSLEVTGDIENDGLINVGLPLGSFSDLRFASSGSLLGSGLLKLASNLGSSRILSINNAVFTNGIDHTISGQGVISGNFVNQGLLSADIPSGELFLFFASLTNQGTMQAVNGGHLQILEPMSQTAGSKIVASGVGSTVSIVSNPLIGGSIESHDGGEIDIAQDSIFDNVELNASITLQRSRELEIQGPLVNNGDLKLVDVGHQSIGSLLFYENTVISGNGSINLGNGGSSSEGVMYAPNKNTITNSVGHSIKGNGYLDLNLINNGLLIVDDPNHTMRFRGDRFYVNDSNILAVNGGHFNASGSIEQSNNASMIAHGKGSRIAFGSGVLSGGKLQSMDGASISFTGSGLIKDIELVSGSMILARSFDTEGSILNNARIEFNSVCFLEVIGDTVISGHGEIVMTDNTSYIRSSNGSILTNQSPHIIHGRGFIYAPVINESIIRADVPGHKLLFSTGAMLNPALIEAIDGAKLEFFNAEVSQDESGIIQAIGEGSEILISESVIRGGALQTLDGAVFNLDNPGVMDNVTLIGEYKLVNQGVSILNTLTNHGEIVLQLVEPHTGFLSPMSFGSNGVLAGTGSVRLDSPSIDTHMLSTPVFGSVIISDGQLIHGRGRIAAKFTNYGRISADIAGERLLVSAADSFSPSLNTNHGIIESTNGATLILDGVTQSASGRILVDGFGSILKLNGQVAEGVLETTNGGKVLIDSSVPLASVDFQAHVEIGRLGYLLFFGVSDLDNDGLIDVNPDNDPDGARLGWGFPPNRILLSGHGTIRLSAPGELAQIYAAPHVPTALGEGQRLEGIGQINMNLVNHGVIAPGFQSKDTVGQLSATQPLELSGSSVLEITIDQSSSDQLVSTNSVILNGELELEFHDGFEPSSTYWSRSIIQASSVQGTFQTVNDPPVSPEFAFRVVYTESEVLIGVSCISDLNLDGTLNFLDVSIFIAAFGNQESVADFNDDGSFNFLDVSVFLAAYAAGCP